MSKKPSPLRASISPAAALVGSILLACAAPAPPPAEEESPTPTPQPSTVRYLDPPSGPGALAPNLAVGADGAYLTWLEPLDGGKGHTLLVAHLPEGSSDRQWTAPLAISSGDDFFANWADLPGSVQTADGTLFAHWLRMLGEGTYAYGVTVAASTDSGETWQELGLLHDDASPTEHGFVSYAPLADGGQAAFWLDGRAMEKGGSMQLRTRRLANSPKIDPEPDTPSGIVASELLDERVCECCSTDAATTYTGPLVVYRDRDADEIRDIAVIRSTPNGWSEPTLIHADGWQIQGCPVNGPAVAARGQTVAVAWFTVAEGQGRVQMAYSQDGGATFGEPTLVDGKAPVGRVDIELDNEGRALVSWIGVADDQAEIRWRRISPDGQSEAVHSVATTVPARAAGVPKMVLQGEDLLFTWVQASDPPQLRAGLLHLE